jgi:hypothetical protein
MKSSHEAPKGVTAALHNEDGMALILVILMVLLLSILSTTMLGTSNSELSIAGNYRNSESAFYAAEAGAAFGVTYDAIYSTLFVGTGGESAWPKPTFGVKLNPTTFAPDGGANDAGRKDYNRITIPGTNPPLTADVKVELLSTGKLPSGTGSQEDSGLGPGTGFKANNYVVTVIGNGPRNSKAVVETEIARIIQQ